MISIVLYGRNDSYGYNLHKRAALSFNCMSEVLADDDDEIIFVDYNTPNDFPTFPEAIQDTLTKRARQRLRILRVRPHVHERFLPMTRLVALEPISRNIAVRRSNPANRWVLSTNTDMIFVLKNAASLSQAVQGLPKTFYHAPRIEIPETLWEGLDRQDATLAIATVRAWGSNLHLNEIVKGAQIILYDGPGDFQLIERADLFEISGFDEEMLLGWHVDSNIAKRLFVRYGAVGDLGEAVFGYHCDHTRQITPMHSHTRTMNDWRRFIRDVTVAELPEQASTWGCPDDDIEEVRLREDTSAVYMASLRQAIGAPLQTAPVVSYADGSFNRIDYDPRHLLPYLIDLFVCLPKGTRVAWGGGRIETLRLFSEAWVSLGFTGPILVEETLVGEGSFVTVPAARLARRDTVLREADAFVFDFGCPVPNPLDPGDVTLPEPLRDALGRSLFGAVGAEHERLRERRSLRQLIAINAICNEYENIFTEHVACGLTPFSTRMRHGYTFPPLEGVQDWSAFLRPGSEGGVVEGGIAIAADRIGNVAYGPYKHLLQGRYRLVFRVAGRALDAGLGPGDLVGFVELRARPHFVAGTPITAAKLAAGRVELEVDIGDGLAGRLDFVLDAVVRTVVPADLVVVGLSGERLGPPGADPAAPDVATRLDNVLPMMLTGSAGRRVGDTVLTRPGDPGLVVYGPFWTLRGGHYAALISAVLSPEARDSTGEWSLLAEVMVDGRLVAVSLAGREQLGGDAWRVEFAVPAVATAADEHPMQIRLFSNAPVPLEVRSIRLRPASGSAASPDPTGADIVSWLRFRLGAAGTWSEGRIRFAAGRRGRVAGGLLRASDPGRYRLELDVQLDFEPSTRDLGDLGLLTIELFAAGRFRARRVLTGLDLSEGSVSQEFEVHADETPEGPELTQLQVYSSGILSGALESVRLRRLGETPGPGPTWLSWPQVGDLLWSMEPGTAQIGPGGSIEVAAGRAGAVVFGPYWPLEPGMHVVTLRGRVEAGGRGDSGPMRGDEPGVVTLAALLDGTVMAVAATAPDPGTFALDLRMSTVQGDAKTRLLELRVGSNGGATLRLDTLTLDSSSARSGPDIGAYAMLPVLARAPGVALGRQGAVIPPERRGHMLFGPGWRLPAGSYVARVGLRAGDVPAAIADPDVLFAVDVYARGTVVAFAVVTAADLRRGAATDLAFTIDPARAEVPDVGLEFRVWSTGLVGATLTRFDLEGSIGTATPTPRLAGPPLLGTNWLPFQTVGSAGRLTTRGVAAAQGAHGPVVHGPYWAIPAGAYQLAVDLATDAPAADEAIVGSVDVTLGDSIAAETPIVGTDLEAGRIILGFDVRPSADPASFPVVEVRLWTLGGAEFLVRSIVVSPARG